jgi:hypothetical protein
MALTADIGSPQGGTIRPIGNPTPQTNVFQGVAKVADMFVGLQDEQAKAKARAVAEESRLRADARAEESHKMQVFDWNVKYQDREAEKAATLLAFDHRSRSVDNMNAPAETVYQDNSRVSITGGQIATPGMFDPNATEQPLGKEGQSAVVKIERYKTALVQGRVSQSMVDLQTRNEIDKFLSKNPDQAAVFAKTLKDRGVEDPFIRSLEVQQDAESSMRELQKQVQTTYVKAASDVGLTVLNADGTVDLVNSMKIGETILRQQDAFNRAKAQLDMVKTRSDVDESQRNAAKKDFGDAAITSSYKVVDEATNSITMSLSSLFRAANTPEQLKQLLTVSVPQARQALQSINSRIIQQMGNDVPPEAYKTVTELIDKRLQDVDQLVTGDASAIQTRLQALKGFETQLGLSKAEAFPAWSYFSEIFGQGNLVELVSGGNLASLLPPDQVESLRQQLKAGIQTKGGRDAALTLSNTALILSGAAKLEDLDPAKQRNSLPGLISVSSSDARTITSTGGGPVVWDRFIKSFAATSNAVVSSALPSTLTQKSFKNSAMALIGGATNNNRPVIAAAILDLAKRPGYEDEARALANTSTIAGQQLLNGSEKLIREVSKNGLFQIQFNDRLGRYETKVDDVKFTSLRKQSSSSDNSFFINSVNNPVLPGKKEAQELTDTLNGLVTNMASLRDLDPTFQGAKVSFEEAKRFFATGKTPESLRNSGDQQVSAKKQFEQASKSFDQSVANSIDVNMKQRDEAIAKNAPRGIRNNNPGNIEYGTFARRQGASGTDGRFATFDTPEEGIKAAENLIKSYGSRGVNTIEKIVNKWAPPNENNTEAYIKQVMKRTGLPRDQQLDLQDPDLVRKIVNAKIWVENGQNPFDTPS